MDIFRKTVIGDDDFRRAKSLIDKLTDDELVEGDFLAFIICNRLFREQSLGARVVQSFLQRILKIPNVLTRISSGGLSIIDLVVICSRSDVVYQILSVSDANSFNDPGRTSCLLFLLIDWFETNKQMRGQVMELLRKLLFEFEINPNLEICNVHPLRLEPIEPYSLADPVFSFLKYRGLLRKSFVNYVNGVCDKVQDYRNRIRKHLYSINNFISKHANAETLFGFYLRNANNYRHRDTCVELILSGKVDLKTIVFIDGVGTTCYQTMCFKKPLKMISQVGGFLISQTPAYFFYIPSSGDPLGTFFRAITTGWEGYISLSTKDFKSVIVDIFDRRLVQPEMSIVKRYIAHGGIFREFKKLSSRGSNFKHLIIRNNPENTGLAKILLTPHCLENFILNKIPVKELLVQGAREQYTFLNRKYPSNFSSPRPIFVNDTFFSNEELINEFPGDPCTIFVSREDGYVFRIEEFQYLIDKKENPYNRRKLEEWELVKLRQLIKDYQEWWLIYPPYLFDQGEQATPPVEEEEPMVTEIDEMLNQSPFFRYGERLRPHLSKLSKPGVIRFLYERLLVSYDSCIPFQTTSTDHSSIEEINICYGILVPKTSETRIGVNIFVQWIYLILDSTRFHSRETLYEGRLICLYNTIMDHLKNFNP